MSQNFSQTRALGGNQFILSPNLLSDVSMWADTKPKARRNKGIARAEGFGIEIQPVSKTFIT